MPIAWHTQLPEDLYAAIGKVAHATAQLDVMLTEFAETLADSSVVWLLVTGQSTDTLVQTCQRLLEEVDPFGTAYPDGFRKRIDARLEELGRLRQLRNQVVHGTWSKYPFDEQPKPRPFGGAENDETFWVARERIRRISDEQAMTRSDVEELASRIDDVTARIIREWRLITPHESDWPPFRRWHQTQRGD